MAAAHQEGVKVLLDGQGADELLGGYDLYLGVRTAGLLLSGHPLASARELRAQVRRGSGTPGSAMWAALHAALPRGTIETIRRATAVGSASAARACLPGSPWRRRPHRRPARSWRSACRHALSVAGLPTLLRYEDRSSMAFGIEARVPFLDVRLIELSVRLPDRLRVDRGVTKAILRHAIGGRLPQAVRDRRDRSGFEAPQREWLEAGRAQVVGLLRGGQLSQRGWVAPAEIERVIVDGLSGGRATEHLWRLFITEGWLRMLWPDAPGIAGHGIWEAAGGSDRPGAAGGASPRSGERSAA